MIGYNYNIIKNSSEISAKAVKRYTSAILIVCVLWSFIGYTFTHRYLLGSTLGSISGAAVFVFLIVQIERQIILAINPTAWLYVFRGLIAMMMAILGAIIIDQIIFKEDIELEKITSIEDRVKKALPPKTAELRSQIAALDTAITNKEIERQNLINDIAKNPTSTVYSTQASNSSVQTSARDSNGKVTTTVKTQPKLITTSSNVANPKIGMVAPLEVVIASLRSQKVEKENALLNIRPKLEKEISSKVGFLDELEVMYTLITRSNVALGIWLIWFCFLMGLEMLVLISKINEKENDYERTVKHHMELQMRQLEVFNRRANGT